MDSISPGRYAISAAAWILPGAQLAATLLILALDAPSVAKVVALLVVWAATFRRWSGRELLCYLAVCGLFSVMDVLAVRQGLFRFSREDIAGLPAWEYFMWGFYSLHMLRTLKGPSPLARRRLALPLAILFAVPFVTVDEPMLLLIVSGAGLAVALFFFHEVHDLHYAAYGVLLGAAVEYVGVWSGQWHYPRQPIGGVELWFATMWGGIGLFTRRLLLPLVGQPGR